jgi:tungstate transport system ATP-binding protein
MTADAPARSDKHRVPTVCGENLKVVYRKRTVLDVPSITVESGQTYALLGASGAGKSTLLRVLGLLEAPTAGRVLLDGRRASRRSLATRRRIAAVFQKPYLLRGTVGANVSYGLRLRGIRGRESATRVADALDSVGLSGWEKRSALTLSGGEAQRVALARALVLKPELLLLDEPLSYMDPLLKRGLTAEFAQILASVDVTAIYVTHDQDEAAVVADRIGVMRDGHIVAEGDPDEVLGLPVDEWLAAFIGMEPALRGRVMETDDGLATIDVAGADFYATSGLPAGTNVVLAVRPEDVTIYESGVELPRGSARNKLDAMVAEIHPGGGTVQVILDHRGTRIAAAVSRASAKELGLAVGVRVVAVFKATAVQVRST